MPTTTTTKRRQRDRERHLYETNNLLMQTPEFGHDGRPTVDPFDDQLLEALWREHADKMPKLARLRWEADHDDEG